MAQLTIYVDDETRRKIEIAAKRAETSVSQWIKDRLSGALQTEWPEGYFDLFGTLRDVDIERPAQSDLGRDTTREAL